MSIGDEVLDQRKGQLIPATVTNVSDFLIEGDSICSICALHCYYHFLNAKIVINWPVSNVPIILLLQSLQVL